MDEELYVGALPERETPRCGGQRYAALGVLSSMVCKGSGDGINLAVVTDEDGYLLGSVAFFLEGDDLFHHPVESLFSPCISFFTFKKSDRNVALVPLLLGAVLRYVLVSVGDHIRKGGGEIRPAPNKIPFVMIIQ